MIRAILLTLSILPTAVVFAQPDVVPGGDDPAAMSLNEAFVCGASVKGVPQADLSSFRNGIERATGEARLELLNDFGVFLLDAKAASCAARVYSVLESALPEQSTQSTRVIHAQYLLNSAIAQRRLGQEEGMYKRYVAAALRAPGLSEPCDIMARDAAEGIAPDALLAALEDLNEGDGFACGVTVMRAAFRSRAFRNDAASAKLLALWASYLAHARVTRDTFANWRDVVAVPNGCPTCDVRVRSLNAAFARDQTLPSPETIASMKRAWGDSAPKLAAVYVSVARHLLAIDERADARPRALTAWQLEQSDDTARLALEVLLDMSPREADPYLASISEWATMDSQSVPLRMLLGVFYRRRSEDESDVRRAVGHWEDAETLAATDFSSDSSWNYALASRFLGDALQSVGCLAQAQERYVQGAERFTKLHKFSYAETMLHKAESLGVAMSTELFRKSEQIRDQILMAQRTDLHDETWDLYLARQWLVSDPTLDVTSLEIGLDNGTLQVRGTMEKPPLAFLREGLYLANVRRVRYLAR